MKTILKAITTLIFTILFLFINFVNVDAQENGQWEILNEGGYFWYIDFVNDQVGWLTSRGKLLKTEDGGETWKSIPMETDSWIYNTDFIDEQTGWCLQYFWDAVEERIYSTIRKSNDGGQTWTTQMNNVGAAEIIVMNDSIVYVTDVPGSSSILKTSDGGMTWTDQTPNLSNFDVRSIWPFDINNVLIVCHTENPEYEGIMILNTFDGGDTWEDKKVPEINYILDIQFINESTGYFTANIHEEEGTSLYKTTDTLNTWTLLYDPDSLSVEFFHAFNNTTIWAIRNSNNGLIDLSRNIIKSTDGGITWEKKQTMWWEIEHVFFTESGVGFMTEFPERSGGMNLYKSTDQGDTWKMKKIGHFLTDIYFINENLGFAGSGYINEGWGHIEPFGNLLITNDGGKSWRHSYSFPNDYIFSCMFINDKVGFVLSRNPLWRGYLYKTVDSGYNWSPVYEENFDLMGYDFTGNDIGFKSEEVGWAVGSGNWADDSSGGIIMETTDGGENWDLVWNYPNNNEYSNYGLNSIHVINTTAWAVGESGLIVKYTEQGEWQVQGTITDLPLNKVFFYDQHHGWIAGGYSDEDNVYLKLFKTIDGGKNWIEIPDFDYRINDMYFADSLHGWAVGNDTSFINVWTPSKSGILLETTDGGENWTVQVEGLSAPLNAINFKDGYGWAVGGNGLVLRTEDGVSWVNQNTGKTYPNKFSLSQNYPNPFNPSTKIKYSLPKPEKVKIEVFNTLGQRVKILLNQHMKADNHEIEFNAQNLSSGIYFYRIEAGEFQDVKKMILIK